MSFYKVQPEWPLVFCSQCSCVIVDDAEGSNRAAHDAAVHRALSAPSPETP